MITILNFCQDTHDWSDEECATQIDMFFAREPLDFRPIFENHLIRGLLQNKKKTYRLYTEENLQMRTKKSKKLTRPLLHLLAPLKMNERWAMDFISDQLSNGRRFRVLNVMNHFNRKMVGQLVGFNISGHQVARFLKELLLIKKNPSEIIFDNGSEFTSKAMFFWSKENNVALNFIQPEKHKTCCQLITRRNISSKTAISCQCHFMIFNQVRNQSKSIMLKNPR